MATASDIEQLRSTIRGFLHQHSPESEVRRLMDDYVGYSAGVWEQMADQLGLQGLAIEERFGGSGFGYNELRVVFEEMGGALFSAPYFATVGLAANALAESGDEQAQYAYLPGIANGKTIATLAISEERGGWDHQAVHTQGMETDSDWTLTGSKRYVPDAHIADVILVAARTSNGISLFAVEKTAAGLTTEVELTMDLTRTLARVNLQDTPARLIGDEGQAWSGLRRALRFAAVALAAEQLGGAQRVLDITVQYAKDRLQFGRPIGSFQAIKHKLADMLVDVESAKSAVYDAASAVASGRDDVELAASVAKSFCSDAYFRTAAQGIQIHGGIGFTWDHPAQLYFKRATSSRAFLGSPGHHRDLVAEALGI